MRLRNTNPCSKSWLTFVFSISERAAPADTLDCDVSPIRRSRRATAGKKVSSAIDDSFETGDDVDDGDFNEDSAAAADAREERPKMTKKDSDVIVLGGKGQPTTLLQAANLQLGIVPKRKRGRPRKERDADGNVIHSSAASAPAATPKTDTKKKTRKRRSKFSLPLISSDEEFVNEDYTMPSAAEHNLVQHIVPSSDEDDDVRPTESFGLTIRPVDAVVDAVLPKTRKKRQSLKIILGGKRAAAEKSSTSPKSLRKKRKKYGYRNDEDFEESTSSAKKDSASVPANLAALVPPGFEMVRHLNDNGAVEYRVKKAPNFPAMALARKSLPPKSSSATEDKALSGSSSAAASASKPKVVEIGNRRRRSSSTKDKANSNVILVGGSGRLSGGGSGGASAKRWGGSRSSMDSRPATPVSDKGSASGGGNFVRLTYKPTEEEMDAARKQQQSLMQQQQQLQQNRRVSPHSHEVTSTTEIDEGGFQQQPGPLDTSNGAEYNLDPSSGILVDKDGNPFQAPFGTDAIAAVQGLGASIGGMVAATGEGGMVMMQQTPAGSSVISNSLQQRHEQVIVNLPTGVEPDEGQGELKCRLLF